MLSKVTFSLKQVIHIVSQTRTNDTSAHKTVVANQFPPLFIKTYVIYLNDHVETSKLVSSCVSALCDRIVRLPQINRIPSSMPSKRGLSSQFRAKRRARLCAHGHEVLRWRAVILKRSWSRNFARTVQRSMPAVLFRPVRWH